MSMVAEGVKSCSVVAELANDLNIEMPISQEVNRVVNEAVTARMAFRGLLNTKTGSEADPG